MPLQYHVQLKEGDVAPYVLLPGDPGRVPIVASFWDEAHEVSNNREYRTFTGVYKGVPISCMSTGMGCPSVAIGMEEDNTPHIKSQYFIARVEEKIFRRFCPLSRF